MRCKRLLKLCVFKCVLFRSFVNNNGNRIRIAKSIHPETYSMIENPSLRAAFPGEGVRNLSVSGDPGWECHSCDFSHFPSQSTMFMPIHNPWQRKISNVVKRLVQANLPYLSIGLLIRWLVRGMMSDVLCHLHLTLSPTSFSPHASSHYCKELASF